MANIVMKKPSSVEAEIAILGSLLIDPQLLAGVSDTLRESEFYENRNKIIYRSLLNIFNSNRNVDLTTLIEELKTNNLLDTVGGFDYLASLGNFGYSTSNIESYIELVKETALRRQSIELLEKLIQDGYNTELKTFDYVNNVEKAVFDLSRKNIIDGFQPVSTVVENVALNTEKLSKQKEDIIGLKTGFKVLDSVTLGFQPTQLIILAARPAMGKSAMALNLAINISKLNVSQSHSGETGPSSRARVAIFSLEMSNEQLVERMIASVSNLNLKDIKRGNLKSEEWDFFQNGCNQISNLNVYFDDSTDLDVSKIRAKCRRLKEQDGLDFVVIDYLQLIKGDANAKSTVDEVTKISRGLKLMAKELNIPVLALSQLSRAVEKRDDKKPMMADLRDSGAIEQDADIVMFLYREDYYDKKSIRINEADLIIGKNRSGSTHEGIPLLFSGACSKFETLEK